MAYIDEEDSRLVLVYMTSNPNATIYAWVTYVNTSYYWHNDMADPCIDGGVGIAGHVHEHKAGILLVDIGHRFILTNKLDFAAEGDFNESAPHSDVRVSVFTHQAR